MFLWEDKWEEGKKEVFPYQMDVVMLTTQPLDAHLSVLKIHCSQH